MAAATSAVYIKEAYKHYGPKSGPKRKDVLDGLCMKVHRGSIYGLLGASGCGKTTLLSCIVGRRKLNSGEIWVLGGTPGTEGSGVPGPRIGYMPQETALIPEFTVRGIVFYFGRIFGMTEKQIESRFRELSKLLDLPPDSRFVGSCSGGQQRRVSFAAAMIHDPELLILDEPTVGLDPVLRERIWEYLVEITNTKNIAVIITTHYIEECRQAHKIGLMREGQLLAEESPADLLNRFRADTLEEVFLELSRRQVAGTLPNQSSADYNQINSISATPVNSASVSSSVVSLEQGNTGSTDFLTNKLKKEKKKTSSITVNPDRLKALFLKNWLQFFRNYGGLAFAVLFPIVQMTVFFLAVGGDPRNLQLAIVNDENGTCDKFNLDNFVYFNNESECEFRQLSCKFLLGIEDPMINKVFYPDVETATQAVHNGKAIGVMYFSHNYTGSTRDRAIEGREASDDSLDFGEVKVWLDMSNRQLGAVLQKKLLDKYIDFQKNIFEVCRYNPQLGEIPVAIKDPIYGHKDESYLMFIIPGFLVTVIFFLATLMTSNILISERLDGVWDRTLVAGATAMEIIIAHVVTQFVIISFQIFELLIICFGLFGADIVGNYRDIIGLMITQGISGMCYGFLISVGCANLTQANFIATGSFYPLIFISGAIWPAEAMPIVLRIIAYIMPFTICIDALRSIIIRGWDATFAIVLDAYGISVAWTAIFILFSFYILKNTM